MQISRLSYFTNGWNLTKNSRSQAVTLPTAFSYRCSNSDISFWNSLKFLSLWHRLETLSGGGICPACFADHSIREHGTLLQVSVGIAWGDINVMWKCNVIFIFSVGRNSQNKSKVWDLNKCFFSAYRAIVLLRTSWLDDNTKIILYLLISLNEITL